MRLNIRSQRGWRPDRFALAFLLLRITLGLNIFMHGVNRFVAGPLTFAASLVSMFQKTPLPAWSVPCFRAHAPVVEATLGSLLLVGFRARAAFVGGSLLIVVLTFGTNPRQHSSTAGVQLIYAAVYAALLALAELDCYSIDHLGSPLDRKIPGA